jgi:superfamily II DNA/RNA helicase
LLTHEEPALTIVFCRLKRVVDELAIGLTQRGVEAHAIHGDMPQGKRNTTMKRLREGHLSVLIASDLASRGIDVDDISHVINFDLPEDPEVYVHRIGRTARAGKKGIAWSFVTPEQGELLTDIEILINAEIPRMDYPDFKPTERPAGFRDATPGGRREGGLTLAHGPAPGEGGAPEQPKVNRIQASLNPDMPVTQADKVDETKFPGGIVPTKMPPKRLIRGIKSNRR